MIKNNKKWSEEDISKLKELFPNNSNEYVAKELHITKSAVTNKAHKLGLYKSEKYERIKEKTVWTDEKVKGLIELYPTMRNEDIAKELKIDAGSEAVKHHAIRLGLKKNIGVREEFVRQAIEKRRIWTPEILCEIAKKYKTKTEFSVKDYCQCKTQQ